MYKRHKHVIVHSRLRGLNCSMDLDLTRHQTLDLVKVFGKFLTPKLCTPQTGSDHSRISGVPMSIQQREEMKA